MEGNVAFHFLHYLVNVPVEDRDRAEALEDGEGLRAIFGGPTPFGVNGTTAECARKRLSECWG